MSGIACSRPPSTSGCPDELKAPPAAERVRAFVALTLPPALLEGVLKVQRRLWGEPAAKPVRWSRPEQLHLTLKFLGHLPRSDLNGLREALDAVGAGQRSFDLGLAGLGCFPHSKRPRVVWIGVTGALAQLEGLQRRVEEALRGFGDPAQEARSFHPHLTIGRVQARGEEGGNLGDLLARTRMRELGVWPVRQIDLIQSELHPQGARYTLLHSVPLDLTGAGTPPG